MIHKHSSLKRKQVYIATLIGEFSPFHGIFQKFWQKMRFLSPAPQKKKRILDMSLVSVQILYSIGLLLAEYPTPGRIVWSFTLLYPVQWRIQEARETHAASQFKFFYIFMQFLANITPNNRLAVTLPQVDYLYFYFSRWLPFNLSALSENFLTSGPLHVWISPV